MNRVLTNEDLRRQAAVLVKFAQGDFEFRITDRSTGEVVVMEEWVLKELFASAAAALGVLLEIEASDSPQDMDGVRAYERIRDAQ